MEDDEIIIINPNVSNNPKKVKNKKKEKAVKKITASKKSKKKDKRARKIKIFVILILLICAIILLLSSSLFNIKEINVSGNNKLAIDEIISISSIKKETNIFSFSKKNVINNLKQEIYVKNANVKLKLPNVVEIEVEERTPKYMLQFADSFVYIDSQGYMLEITNIPLEVPILIGFVTDLSNIHVGNRMVVEDLRKMQITNQIVEIAKSNEIDSLITKIDISKEKDYTLLFENEGKIAYLGEFTDINTKILSLKEILELEEGNKGEIFLNIDLKTKDPYFRENVDI